METVFIALWTCLGGSFFVFHKYPSPLITLEDISLLSLELEYGSDRPGDDGPLLEIKLGGPLQPVK